ncbi:MAG: alpha/beta hydrolase, partial [Chloroflexi bacterium]|nr:alpha/beta hydrolase [Chloroflexota bacterium]
MAQQTTSAGIHRMHLSKNEMIDYHYIRVIGYQQYGASSVGECLYAIDQIKQAGETVAAWVAAWSELGADVAARAQSELKAGNHQSARFSYLCAYNYYRTAEFYFLPPGSPEHKQLYRQALDCFEAAGRLSDPPFEAVEIPYENGVTMPGYFFKVADDGQPRPTVIIVGGGDAYGEEAYLMAGVPLALERGLNVLVFHGPGQRGMLLRHPEHTFRPDYEVPVSAVVDYLCSRPEVDPERLTLLGYSLGGYLGARAVAYDKRIKAVVLNALMPSFYDYMMGGISGELPGAIGGFVVNALETWSDSFINWVGQRLMGKSDIHRATAELYMFWANGVSSFAEYLKTIKHYNIYGLEKQIACPVLVVQGEGEGAVPRQMATDYLEKL